MSHPHYDIVDVHVSSVTPVVDAILRDPILDGNKKYTIEVTEFTCPLSAEPPLIDFPLSKIGNLYLLNVRRRVFNLPIIHANNSLLTLDPLLTLRPRIAPFNYFIPNKFSPISTVNDLVFHMQRYFDQIKEVYRTNTAIVGYAGGIIAGSHGGGADVTTDQVNDDDWVHVNLTPNGTLQLRMSNLFCKHFYIKISNFSKKLFGFPEDIIAARVDGGGVIQTGLQGLTGGIDPAAMVIYGEPGETVILQCNYPLFNHFDHRVELELDSGGMPIPNIIKWSTNNKQGIRKSLATFPIVQETETSIHIDNAGAATGNIVHRSRLLQGAMIWRRAESKISERFEILNSQFFQNIRLEVFIERRVWDTAATPQQYKFQRTRVRLNEGDSWTAKIRFRTLSK